MYILIACIALAVSTASAKEWQFTGTIEGIYNPTASDGTPRMTVFVKIDTDHILLNSFRIILNQLDGSVIQSVWMLKPMPSLNAPQMLPVLLEAHSNRFCRLTFTADKWDLETKDSGRISLIGFEWIQEQTQQGGPGYPPQSVGSPDP